MVEIGARAWSRWRELSDESIKPTIWLLFTSSLSPSDALAVIDAAAEDAFSALLSELADIGERRSEFYRTVLRTAAVPRGVSLEIGEGIEDFERLLELVCGALDLRGVDGRLDVIDSVGRELPREVPILECRLRVTGERVKAEWPYSRWRPEPAAWESLLDAGLEWCTAAGAGVSSLQVELMPRVAVGPSDDLRVLFLRGVAKSELGVVDCASGTADRWRMLAAEPAHTRVTLIDAGESLQPDGWRDSIDDCKEFLAANSSSLAYAFLKAGGSVPVARNGRSLIALPARPGFRPSTRLEWAFEGSFAPDAFGLQLLGPGYVGRIPTGPSWHETQLASSRVLLQHIQPELWFQPDYERPRAGARPTRGAAVPGPSPSGLRRHPLHRRHDHDPTLKSALPDLVPSRTLLHDALRVRRPTLYERRWRLGRPGFWPGGGSARCRVRCPLTPEVFQDKRAH